MAITFDATNKRIILDSTSVSASQIWIAWIDWVAVSDNAKYQPALKQVGGDSLGSGLLIPPYIFLINNWRVRPMEQDHDLTITGNLFVDGGGTPVVRTLGQFQVNVNYTVPVQAQAIQISSGATTNQSVSANSSTGHPTAEEIWNYQGRTLTSGIPSASEISSSVWSNPIASKLMTMAKFLGMK